MPRKIDHDGPQGDGKGEDEHTHIPPQKPDSWSGGEGFAKWINESLEKADSPRKPSGPEADE